MVADVEGLLAHFGVKGMKLGVRKDNGHEGERAKTKVIEKADKKYKKAYSGISGGFKIYNEVAGEMNKRLDGMNAKFKDVDFDLNDPSKKKNNDAYWKAYEDTVQESVGAAMKNIGTNASGTGRVKLTKVGEGQSTWFSAEWEDLKHEDERAPAFKIVPKFRGGKIVGQTITALETDEDLKQMDETEEFLAHYGIKGMKWGKLTGGRDGVGPGASGRGGSGDSDRLSNRQLNKASRAKDETNRRAEVLAARQRIYGEGNKNQNKLKDAKEQYKKDKIEKGSREARKILNKVKDDNWSDLEKSKEYLNGKELATDILVNIATVPLGRLGPIVGEMARQRTIIKSVKNKD